MHPHDEDTLALTKRKSENETYTFICGIRNAMIVTNRATWNLPAMRAPVTMEEVWEFARIVGMATGEKIGPSMFCYSWGLERG